MRKMGKGDGRGNVLLVNLVIPYTSFPPTFSSLVTPSETQLGNTPPLPHSGVSARSVALNIKLLSLRIIVFAFYTLKHVELLCRLENKNVLIVSFK